MYQIFKITRIFEKRPKKRLQTLFLTTRLKKLRRVEK